jgi:hypothetical protein
MKKIFLATIITISPILAQCDCNDDDILDVLDLIVAVNCVVYYPMPDGSGCPCIGCDSDSNFDILDIVAMVNCIIDGECWEGEIYGCTDPDALNYNSDAMIDDGNCYYEFYYNVEIEDVGANQELIFSEGLMNLEYGDEIGVFDVNAWIDQYQSVGELLVGTGMWSNEELTIFPIEGLNYDWGGPQLPGYVSENPIYIRIYRYSENFEYNTDILFSSGDGLFGWQSDTISELIFLTEDTFGCTDSDALNYDPLVYTDDGSCYDEYHFDFPPQVWQFQTVQFSESISSLSYGFEIGVFDAFGIISSSNWIIGDQIVGRGVWLGQTIDYTASKAIQYQNHLWRGYIEGNEILIRIFDHEIQQEYLTEILEYDGSLLFNGSTLIIHELQITEPAVYGCIDPLASNYNPDANVSGNNCLYFTPSYQNE